MQILFSISRKLVKGLNNYKQDTVASYFNIVNEINHNRAVTDAEVMWENINSIIRD
jgi:hypothetical protein